MLKTAICACPTYTTAPRDMRHCTTDGYRRVVPGWVYRVGNTGEYRYPASLLEEGPTPAKRAPEAPQGLEWVGVGPGRSWDGGRDGSWYHPCGARSVSPGPLPVPGPSECPPTAKGARFSVISCKVSQNGQVSLNILKRPPILPISKTGLKSHLLKFSVFHSGQPSLTRN